MKSVLLSLLVALALASAATFYFSQNDNSFIPKRHTATFSPEKTNLIIQAVEDSPLALLTQTALKYDIFEANGLTVNVEEVPLNSGAEAVDKVVAGQLDLSMANEFAITQKILEGNDLFILSSVAVARDNLGIVTKKNNFSKYSQLEGKRVGITPGSNAQYYLELLSISKTINTDQITFVEIPPQEMSTAISENKVDAVVTWEPFLSQTVTALGDEAQLWKKPLSYNSYFLLFVDQNFLLKNPETVAAFVQSLIEAEKYLNTDAKLAKEFQSNTQLSEQDIAALIESGYYYNVQFEEALKLEMLFQADWLKNSDPNRYPEPITKIREALYPDLLLRLDSKRVTITE